MIGIQIWKPQGATDMADNKNEHVVIAIFSSEEIAHQAADTLKNWDKATEEIKLGAVGVMTADADGKVQLHIGRKAGKGAAIGAVVGVIATVLTGGVAVLGAGLLAGGTVGGVLGAFAKKSTNLTKDEIDEIGADLKDGKAAVIVTCDEYEVESTADQLTKVGGKIKSYVVSADAMSAAVAAGTGETAAPLSPAERATAEVESAEPDVPPADKEHGTIVPPPAPF
jgi:uncharacterized membrane protein